MNNPLSPFKTLTDTIEKRRLEAVRRKQTNAYIVNIVRILLIIALMVALFNILFSFKIVNDNNMFPAVSAGDLTLCYRQSSFVKNDVVFYTYDGQEYIGRVVAKGGDVVNFTDNGTLTVNGTPQEGEIVYSTYKPDNWTEAMQIPDGYVYILGDKRIDSQDSRNFGAIPTKDITGKVICLIRHNGI